MNIGGIRWDGRSIFDCEGYGMDAWDMQHYRFCLRLALVHNHRLDTLELLLVEPVRPGSCACDFQLKVIRNTSLKKFRVKTKLLLF